PGRGGRGHGRRMASVFRPHADLQRLGRAAGHARRHPAPGGVALQSPDMNLLLPVLLAATIAPPSSPSQTYRVLSQTYTIDKKYRSMEGPASVQRIRLGDPAKPVELLWITGVRTEMM